MRSKALWILSAVLLISNLVMAYLLVDQAVTSDHQSRALEWASEDISLLQRLVVDLPRDHGPEDVVVWLEATFPGEVIKREDDTIAVGSIILVFRDERLQDVRTM